MNALSFADQAQSARSASSTRQHPLQFPNHHSQPKVSNNNFGQTSVCTFENDIMWPYSPTFNAEEQSEMNTMQNDPSQGLIYDFQLSPGASIGSARQCFQVAQASPRSSDGSSPILPDEANKLDRRRAQNRASQRAFRLRKEKRLSDASRRVAELEQIVVDMDNSHMLLERIACLEQQVSALEAENMLLQCQVTEPSCWMKI